MIIPRLSDLRSEHQKRVALFASLMGFSVPDVPSSLILSNRTRLLLAKLIFEEVMELIVDGLKVEVIATPPVDGQDQDFGFRELVDQGIDPVEVVDGVCDVRFVATKIMCLLGLPDEPFQHEVDMNNLLKFSDGHYYDQNGKLRKPIDHPHPNIEKMLQVMINSKLDPTLTRCWKNA
jgi:hypothetical protein